MLKGNAASHAVVLCLAVFASVARGGIYQWQWVNPSDTSQGKCQSTTLCPGGAGVMSAPGTHLENLDLTRAYLIGATLSYSYANSAIFANADLSGARLDYATFTGASLSNANLQNTWFIDTELTGVNFTGAVIAGAQFTSTQFSTPQLYSTASYKAADLHGLKLYGTSLLAGGDFHGQDLSNAVLCEDYFAGSNFRGAKLTDADLSSTTWDNTDFTGADLSGVWIYGSAKNVNFSQANLTGAAFAGTDLSGSVFTDATITGTDFAYEGFTQSMLYSTASYKTKNLKRVGLSGINMSGWDFTGQNLDGAAINGTVTNALFSGAVITNAMFLVGTGGMATAQLQSTASYQSKDLHGIRVLTSDLSGMDFSGFNLSGADLSQLNLTNASFKNADLSGVKFYAVQGGYQAYQSNLTGVDFTNALVAGAVFFVGNTGPTAAQFYSTASYAAKDLSGITLKGNLTGWDFSGQALVGAIFAGATLTNASFQGANLANANLGDGTPINGTNFAGATIAGASISSSFTSAQLYSTASYIDKELHDVKFLYTNLTGWNFNDQNLSRASGLTNAAFYSGADLRGCSFRPPPGISANAILYNGEIAGLNLNGSDPKLIVRNYIPNTGAIYTGAIHVRNQATIAEGSSVLALLDGLPWNSTISFDAGIPVSLLGTLEVRLKDGVDVSALLGRPIRLFDWSGVVLNGQFTFEDNLPVGYYWDTTQLYTTGVITEVPEPASVVLILIGAAGLLTRRSINPNRAKAAATSSECRATSGTYCSGPSIQP